MLDGKRIAVVVPCYNEGTQIGGVVSTMPDFVDRVVVVDDASTDGTSEAVLAMGAARRDEGATLDSAPRLTLVRHDRNQGVGAAIATGYKLCAKSDIDVAAVMAGDGQMDPDDLTAILQPVIDGEVDYSKGNRLFTGEAWNVIPRVRYVGNSILSLLTKIASGYWHIADSQSGYCAINKKALRLIDWDRMYKRYGQPNDLLVRLNVLGMRVRDVPINPVYNVGEKSGVRVWKVVFTISWLLLRMFLWRLREKYVIRDFHPLVFFYLLAFVLFVAGAALTTRLVWLWVLRSYAPPMTSLALLFCGVTCLQSLFFAMWFDMEKNKVLR